MTSRAGQPEAAAEAHDLRDRITELIPSLSPRQQKIVEGLLEELTVSELSRRLRVPRATLYGELDRIRGTFINEGLDRYLR